MAEVATIARPYAEAAFKAADAKGQLGEWSGTLKSLAGLAANDEVAAVISNPKVSGAQVVDLFGSLLKGGLSGEAKTFVQLLVDNNRVVALEQVSRQFEQLKNARETTLDAKVTSAFALDESQLKALCADLEKKFGNKIKATVVIDQELIGGVKVQVGDTVIDSSVKAKLESLRNGLKS